MPDVHAKLCSPSGAEGWFACAGRIVMEAGFPDSGSEYSADGSARHAVVAACLANGLAVSTFVGSDIIVDDRTIVYRDEWVEEDFDYVSTIRTLAEGGELFIEQEVNFERYTEVKGDSFGTADAVILKPLADGTYELIVGDRKTGYHEVPVEHNKQLQLYALGAYDEHSLVYDISRVRLIIHQRAAREWDCSVEELLQFGQEARSKACTVVNAVQMHGKVDPAEWQRTFLNQSPSEDACRYCKAMATCPSMQRTVQQVVGADFEDMASGDALHEGKLVPMLNGTPLHHQMHAVALVEDWCKAVRAEVERQLLAGGQVPGWGLELGKQGNRAWSDEATAEATLKSMRLKTEEMYDLKLISPTAAEKLAPKFDKQGKVVPPKEGAPAPAIGPRQWKTLQGLITRAPPKPSVKPASVITKPYVPTPVADDFAVVEEGADLA